MPNGRYLIIKRGGAIYRGLICWASIQISYTHELIKNSHMTTHLAYSSIGSRDFTNPHHAIFGGKFSNRFTGCLTIKPANTREKKACWSQHSMVVIWEFFMVQVCKKIFSINFV
jgi:hypothetical protein